MAVELPALKKGRVFGMAQVSVNVFNDLNHNSNQGNGDRGISGVLLELVLYDEAEEEGTIVSTGVTGQDGTQVFSRLPAGTYSIRCYLPEGYAYSEKSPRTNSIKDNAMERQSAPQQESPLFTLEEAGEWKMGIGATETARFEGRAWIDENGNGLMEEDEPPLAELTVDMKGVRNGLAYRTVTDAEGFYSFTQLRKGSYRMEAALPEPYVLTVNARGAQFPRGRNAREGSSAFSADITFDNRTMALENQNIGVYIPAALTGLCFLDENGNGIPEPEEPGLERVEISLWREGETQRMARAVSGADGLYSFEGLRPGVYRVEATLPGGRYVFTTADAGEEGNAFAQGKGRRSSLSDVLITNGTTLRLNAGAAVE